MKSIINFILTCNYIKCGVVGWCFECFWTGIKHIPHMKSCPSRSLPCKTSLWMFFIYGFASLLKPISSKTKCFPTFIRGFIYTILIFMIEYLSGSFLKKHNACPWDYSSCKTNINGIIRIDYAPLWYIAGLIYEKILSDT